MRHEMELDLERRLACARYHGPVSVDDIEFLFEKMVSLPGWEKDFARLVIYDDGEFGDIDLEEARRMFDVVNALRAKYFGEVVPPTAHVCSDPIKRVFVKTWLATILRVSVEDADIFHSEQDAIDWLDKVRGR